MKENKILGNEEEDEQENDDFNPPIELNEYGEACPELIRIRVYDVEHTYYEDFTIEKFAKVLNLSVLI